MLNRIFLITLLFLLGSATGCNDSGQTAGSKSTDPPKDSSSKNESVSQQATPIIIDVRSKEEWDSGHLDEAIHLPHEEIPNKIAEVTTNKSAKLVLY